MQSKLGSIRGHVDLLLHVYHALHVLFIKNRFPVLRMFSEWDWTPYVGLRHSLVPRPFPPPVFDRLHKNGGGRPWEKESRA